MNRQQLEGIRNGSSRCPSELDLDHLVGKRLSLSEASSLQQHVAGCSRCTARMEVRHGGWGAFSKAEPPVMMAAIRHRLAAENAKPSGRLPLRRLSLVLGSLCAAAGLVILVVRPTDRQTPPASGPRLAYDTRSKGGLALHVYRLASGIVEPMVSGERLSAGETIKFAVDLPRAGYVNVLGIDASGKLYVAWPSSASVSTLRQSGDGQELPGAMAPDGAEGPETLYVVQCPEATGQPVRICTAAQGSGPPVCPSSCASSPFMLRK
jgi:hypothetical protein